MSSVGPQLKPPPPPPPSRIKVIITKSEGQKETKSISFGVHDTWEDVKEKVAKEAGKVDVRRLHMTYNGKVVRDKGTVLSDIKKDDTVVMCTVAKDSFATSR